MRTKEKAVSIGFKFLFSLFILYRVFCLDIFPVLTSDSDTYLEKTVSKMFLNDPASILMPNHYKTAGYPLYLNFCYFVSGALDTDPMTTAVFGQRALLALSVLWLVLELGLASVPIALFFTSQAFLAHSNFVLTEGATVPAGIMFALSLSRLNKLQKEANAAKTTRLWVLFSICGLSYFFLLLIKIPFAAFALLFVPLGLQISLKSFKPRFRRKLMVAPAAILVAVTTGYLLCVSIGNFRAFNRFSPAIGGDYVFYWGLWEQTFRDNPKNRKDPKLAEFYDHGKPYEFLHRVEKSCGGLWKFECSDPLDRNHAMELIEKSGTSLAKERLVAFFKGFFGVGKFELAAHRNKILAANGDDSAIRALHGQMNKRFMQYFENGDIKIVHGFSKGKMGPEWVKAPQAVLTAIFILAFAGFAAMRKVEAFDLYSLSLATFAILIASFAWLLADVWRYIAPPFAVFSVIQCICIADIAKQWRTLH